jgi:hypothetical protein
LIFKRQGGDGKTPKRQNIVFIQVIATPSKLLLCNQVHHNPLPSSSAMLTSGSKTKMLMITWSKACISDLNQLRLPKKTNNAP